MLTMKYANHEMCLMQDKRELWFIIREVVYGNGMIAIIWELGEVAVDQLSTAEEFWLFLSGERQVSQSTQMMDMPPC